MQESSQSSSQLEKLAMAHSLYEQTQKRELLLKKWGASSNISSGGLDAGLLEAPVCSRALKNHRKQ
jgi:hypothetical protein